MPWSDWITPPPDSYVLSGVQAASAGGVIDDENVPADLDATAALESLRADIAAGAGAPTYPNFVADFAAVQAQVTKGLGTTTTFLAMAQGVLGLAGSAYADIFDWMPAELADLQLGLDYDVRPDRTAGDEDAYVQYETDHTTFLGWLDWSFTLTYGVVTPAGTDYPPAAPWTGAGFDLRLAYSDPPAGIPSPWLPYGAGTQIGTINVPVDLRFGAYSGTTPSLDITVPLSLVDVADLSLLAQPSFLDTAPVPSPAAGDIPMPTGGENSFGAGVEVGPVGAFTKPTIRWQRPRWRYWRPTTGGPALRLTQRNDGLGPRGHARLPGGRNAGTSIQQMTAAPRLGPRNTYL